jgi:hypothetical protein
MSGRDHAQKGNDHEHGNHNDERRSNPAETESEGSEKGESNQGNQTSRQGHEEREGATFKQAEGRQQEGARPRTLRRKEGATIADIAKATDWQNHSIRGFLSGTVTKKMGLVLESSKDEGGERTYRITE